MNIEKLLNEVKHISKHYKEIAKHTGENFNIFNTLELTTDEVRLHSSLLAELLNTKGSHGQGSLFLKLFVNQLDLKGFQTEMTEAFCERYIGVVTDNSGGRLDVLIDGDKNSIIIENKIYADDQENQLLRYHNYAEKERKKGKQVNLYYLNLFGDEPTEKSIGTLKADDYKIISYRSDIIEWLEQCMKESVSLPVIRETLQQYINLLKILTNQTPNNKMEYEIKKVIRPHLSEAKLIAENYEKVIFELYEDVHAKLKSEIIKIINEKDWKICWERNDRGVIAVCPKNRDNSPCVIGIENLNPLYKNPHFGGKFFIGVFEYNNGTTYYDYMKKGGTPVEKNNFWRNVMYISNYGNHEVSSKNIELYEYITEQKRMTGFIEHLEKEFCNYFKDNFKQLEKAIESV